MFIHNVRLAGLLSFGPDGIEVPLQPLNVLIGPNGSGKSNFLEVLSLIRSSPNDVSRPIREAGGIGDWLWKGEGAAASAMIDVVVDGPEDGMPLRHVLQFTEHAERFEVVDERIENVRPRPKQEEVHFHYRYQDGRPVLSEPSLELRPLAREMVKPGESILSQVRDPSRYPALHWLQARYGEIRLYRDWSFGPTAGWRRGQAVDGWSSDLSEGGENLSLVASRVVSMVKPRLLECMKWLYDGIEDINVGILGGKAVVFLSERGGRRIPAARLSDGTLRFLSLLTVLLHPAPPPLVAIEEPELGLHPDVLPRLAALLVEASSRMQLVVTTHSRMLVDALSENAGSVVVCSKHDGESRFERLDEDQLAAWLKTYSLGDLWSMGEIGGNPS